MKKNQLFYIVSFTLVILFVLITAFLFSQPDRLLHIVFCDVGQGDGIYIRFPGGEDMVIDGGPNSNILSCLGDHMAFLDRTVEIVLLTHPQYDHYRGLTDMVSRYNVKILIASPVENKAESYQEFKKIVRENKIAVINAYAGDGIRIGDAASGKNVEIAVLSPDKIWVADNISSINQHDDLLSNKVLGLTTKHDDLNDFTIVTQISYGLFDVLLSGDAESKVLDKIINDGKIVSNDIEVLKIAHHGARAGLNQNIAEYIKPDLAVISVGKNNRYGHPTKEVLEILESLNIPIKRTDLDGEVETVTDGKRWHLIE